ncbi:hypothetical protein A3B02_00340 [Candidatus Roizmanbacteria bacterium RIFCSPLOWO2_01_FULL_42_14]|uniref:Uncharacterized protein n=1 Tax=Candidatus Roizmanbacteria bacterium RIFCSPLOWO2_01_FULL_42_14 TaxID=1802068 RepID=A0A1F7J760_9BACT|nr:MAG: hypothetical protein A3B02_00340 [Candidatus Roizmanbacteria bacterium RIFCSPLOWO2_01_FULL_42_14]
MAWLPCYYQDMDGKRAVILSFAAYAAGYTLTYLGSLYLKADFISERSSVVMSMYSIMTTILLTLIFTAWYFYSQRTKPRLTYGLYFGCAIVFFFFIGDFVLTVLPSVLNGNITRALSYYINPLFITHLAIIPIVAAVTGEYLAKVKRPH